MKFCKAGRRSRACAEIFVARIKSATLRLCQAAIVQAVRAYDAIEALSASIPSQTAEHLLSGIEEGLRLFVRLAEMGEAGT